MRWAAILAGGSGTRFWPLSTPDHPKQLLPLLGSTSTAVQAVARLEGLVPRERILLVTGPGLAPRMQAELGLPPANVLVEPRAASTAPALAWATQEAARRDPDATVLATHADWAVPDAAAFRASASAALDAAEAHDRLVTVGIVPTRPDTGYGYIIPGAELAPDVRAVAQFTEKPEASVAARLVDEGALWNSGLFAWTARRLAREVTAHAPELAPHTSRLDQGDVDGYFTAVTPIAIDVAVLERSARVAVVPGRFAWDDVGTWDALARVRVADAQGNVHHGPVHFHEAQGCVAWSDGVPLVVAGMEDVVVVHANGRVLVMPRARAADLKQVLDALPPDVREVRE